MKKILLGTLLAAVIIAPASFAETTTYTEKFIQKHTQKIVDKESDCKNCFIFVINSLCVKTSSYVRFNYNFCAYFN